MVDVSDKQVTDRTARAEAWVAVGPQIASMLRETGGVAKGGVLEAARLAGIMAAKRTAELVPMCHPLQLDVVEVDATLVEDRVRIVSRVACRGKTGVEMEAMTAAAVAALTGAVRQRQQGRAQAARRDRRLPGRPRHRGRCACRRVAPPGEPPRQ
jgi:cyclic pyranopterin phosphate synthase